jgi:hypothetical protein
MSPLKTLVGDFGVLEGSSARIAKLVVGIDTAACLTLAAKTYVFELYMLFILC